MAILDYTRVLIVLAPFRSLEHSDECTTSLGQLKNLEADRIAEPTPPRLQAWFLKNNLV